MRRRLPKSISSTSAGLSPTLILPLQAQDSTGVWTGSPNENGWSGVTWRLEILLCVGYLIKAILIVLELVEKLNKGKLPKNDYPCMNDLSPTYYGTSQSASVQANQVKAPHSRRKATWAHPQNSEDGYSSCGLVISYLRS